jgi:uncharacterized protein (TIGR02996 family)
VSDRDALLAAIRDMPDEDTPRLVFADYLEENDEAARAAFIRAQVELARTLPWEPFAVRCRWREPDVLTGRAFRAALPPLPGRTLPAWDDPPFRRGFGWALLVRSVSLWAELVEPVFEREPVGKLAFWGGTLDDWLRIAASAHVKQFRDLSFQTNPIEPLRVLRDLPDACGVTDIRFQRASGAGMPEVVEDLMRAPLGQAIGGLHFHMGYESLNDLIDAINLRDPLERLSFSSMGITADHLRRLFAGPAPAALTELRLHNEPLGDDGLSVLSDRLPVGLRDLDLSMSVGRGDGLEALARCEHLAGLRRLNLRRNHLTPRTSRLLSRARVFAGLRSLDLSDCRIGDKGVRHVAQAKFWPNLVELDLRQNPISPAGVRHLLDAAPPAELTALVLDGEGLGTDTRAALTKKYGAALVFAAPEVQGL